MTYQIYSETYFSEEHGNYKSYGIRLIKDGQEIKRIKDISIDVAYVVHIENLLNTNDVSEFHFDEVIEDLLS